jgi:hypothetical protein
MKHVYYVMLGLGGFFTGMNLADRHYGLAAGAVFMLIVLLANRRQFVE